GVVTKEGEMPETTQTAETTSETLVVEEAVSETPQAEPEPLKKALEAERKVRRDAEKAMREQAKEREKLREQSMTDQEKAVEEARRAARTEALSEVGADRVDDAVRVAAAGRPVDVDALLDGLDRKRFLTEDHRPDVAAIQTWVDRITPKQEQSDDATKPNGFEVFDLGQGLTTPAGSDPLLTHLKSALGA